MILKRIDFKEGSPRLGLARRTALAHRLGPAGRVTLISASASACHGPGSPGPACDRKATTHIPVIGRNDKNLLKF
jgi:hypothetical protein